jgi:hypothetical protein
VNCHGADTAREPLIQLTRAQHYPLLHRRTARNECRKFHPEVGEGVEVRKQELFRVVVSTFATLKGGPLEEWAYAITIFAYAVDQSPPARIIGRVLFGPVETQAEHDGSNRNGSAVCALLTETPRLRGKELVRMAFVLPTRVWHINKKLVLKLLFKMQPKKHSLRKNKNNTNNCV